MLKPMQIPQFLPVAMSPSIKMPPASFIFLPKVFLLLISHTHCCCLGEYHTASKTSSEKRVRRNSSSFLHRSRYLSLLFPSRKESLPLLMSLAEEMNRLLRTLDIFLLFYRARQRSILRERVRPTEKKKRERIFRPRKRKERKREEKELWSGYVCIRANGINRGFRK